MNLCLGKLEQLCSESQTEILSYNFNCARLSTESRRETIMRLNDKKVLVTAAAQGIGRAIVESFLNEGAIVTAVDINYDLVSSIDGVEAIKVDVTQKESLVEVVSSKDFDVLVNCA